MSLTATGKVDPTVTSLTGGEGAAEASSTPVQSAPPPTQRVIYGEDNRQDVYAVAEAWRQRAKATLTLIDADQVRVEGDRARLQTSTYDVCAKERFSEQRTLGWCSAWWVGEDLVITAGHCISPGEEDNVKMVSDFAIEQPGAATPTSVPASSVYGVRRVVYSVMDPDT